tara:strand:- start:190 stop:639 length:450 start_codon:yes stop_codon:yes gene_type:complete
MSKVARAATVGSKQRTETITASKTITKDETGEMYLINHNAASAVTITLPAARDGAYFKFLFIASMTNASASLVLTTAGERLVGTLFCTEDDGTDCVNKWDDGSDDVKVTLSDDINRGSWMEVVSDGTSWYITGMVDVPAGTAGSNVVFA